jgi:hypothetical protein
VIAADLACALDAAIFGEHATGFALDGWQRTALRSTAARMLWCVTRQGGKSATAALLALHTATYRPRSTVLLVSPSQRQSGELHRKVLDAFRATGAPAPAEAETALRLELTNGSRVVSLPGRTDATVRGYAADLVIVDEASRVPDDLYRSLTPMLAVRRGSRLLALSTPYGKVGWFHREWEDGGACWERTRITADQCPRISPEFLDQERQSMPAAWFRQEYLCSFEEAEDSVFRHDDIRAAFSDDVAPLFGGSAA